MNLLEQGLKVGDTVCCTYRGDGVVRDIVKNDAYPIKVDFDNGDFESYTVDGAVSTKFAKTLSLSQRDSVSDVDSVTQDIEPREPAENWDGEEKLKVGHRVFVDNQVSEVITAKPDKENFIVLKDSNGIYDIFNTLGREELKPIPQTKKIDHSALIREINELELKINSIRDIVYAENNETENTN